MFDGVSGWAVVVPIQARVDVARDACIVATGIALALENVDESLSEATHAKTGA